MKQTNFRIKNKETIYQSRFGIDLLSLSTIIKYGDFKTFKFSEILQCDPLYALEFYYSYKLLIDHELFIKMIELKNNGYFDGAEPFLLELEKKDNEIMLTDFNLKGDRIIMSKMQFNAQELKFQEELNKDKIKIIKNESND